MASNVTRVVEIREENRYQPSLDRKHPLLMPVFIVFNNTPPAVLHVNKESRNMAKRYYEMGTVDLCDFATYFNPDADIIYLTFLCPTSPMVMRINDWLEDWFGGRFPRVALRMKLISAMDVIFETLMEVGVEEIMLVDETRVIREDEHRARHIIDIDRNMDLVALKPVDMIKENAWLPGNPEFDTPEEMIWDFVCSAGDFTFTVRGLLDDLKSLGEDGLGRPWKNEASAEFNPIHQ